MAEMPGSSKCVQIAETSGISQIYVVTLKALLVTLFEKVTNNVTLSGVDMGGGQRGQLCDHWFPRFSQTLICTVGNLKKIAISRDPVVKIKSYTSKTHIFSKKECVLDFVALCATSGSQDMPKH